WCTQYLIQCVQFLLHFWRCTQYTIWCSCSTVASAVGVQYLIQCVQFRLHFWWCTQYSAAVVQLLIQCRRCTQYLIQCSVVLQNKIYIMSRRPPRRGRRSQATNRGQAASAQSSLPSNAAAKAAYSTGSFFTVTPSVAPPSCTEESPELFDHSVGYMLLEDAQRFDGSDVGSQVEEGS
ncbi:hypothetical protein AB205_0060090, partial [Aquarana catesbeiana]